MRFAIAILLVGCVLVQSASAELIITSDTTIDFRVNFQEGPVDIFDGPNSATTVEIVEGAIIIPNVRVWNESVLNMRGGITDDAVLAYDRSTINIFDGDVAREDIRMFDASVANIHGGHFGDDIIASDSATVHLYGGTFEKAGDGASLLVQQDAVINVYLREYEAIDPGTNRLIGTLLDGSEIDVAITVDPVELRDARIVLHVIPEPTSLTLAITMGFVLIFFASTRRNRSVRSTGPP